MPHRRPKPSIVLGTVAALAIATPVAVWGVTSTAGIQPAAESSSIAVPTQIAQVVLAQVPDIVIPLREITGLDLPDLHLSDLKKLPIPSQIRLPQNLPLPGGVALPETLKLPLDALPPAPAPGDVAAPLPAAPAPPAAEQVGTAVKEITRDTPFSMIALTSEAGATAAKLRAKLADGSWGPWFATEQIDSRKDDRTTGGKTGTEPVFVGNTTAVQVLVTKAAQALAGLPATGAADPAPAPVPAPAPAPALPNVLTPADPAQAPIPFAPAAVSTPLSAQGPAAQLADAVTAVLIQPGSGAADTTLSDIASPLGGSGPKVITRSQWGADESIRCQDPSYDDSLGGATVHHTAGSNDYTKAESAGIVRSIYAYHAQTLGWCDIGYNALVDKYGQTFEGRFGGLDRNVQAAHAGGFNENTMGIAMMGDYSTVTPPQVTLDAVGRYLGWRLAKAGLDPTGRTTMYSEGTEYTPYPQGEAVDLPIIFAHRDVGNTSCPGDAAYAKMDQIRSIAKANPGGGSGVLAVAGDAPGQRQAAAGTGSASSLGALVGELLKLTDQSPIAQKWIAEGGDAGRLGASETGEIPVKSGFKLVKFAHGAISTSPNGGVWTVLGRIFESWRQSGLDTGTLGLPTTDEYSVAGGKRTDFENGSLIFNEVSGVVTTVLKAYNEAYAKALPPADAAAAPAPAAPAPAPAPIEPTPAPVELTPGA